MVYLMMLLCLLKNFNQYEHNLSNPNYFGNYFGNYFYK